MPARVKTMQHSSHMRKKMSVHYEHARKGNEAMATAVGPTEYRIQNGCNLADPLPIVILFSPATNMQCVPSKAAVTAELVYLTMQFVAFSVSTCCQVSF